MREDNPDVVGVSLETDSREEPSDSVVKIKITDNNILSSVGAENVHAFMRAAGGAMGRPGEFKFYCLSDGCIKLYYGNIFNSELDSGLIDNLLKEQRTLRDWYGVSLGMGNYLYVNPVYKETFDEYSQLKQKHIYQTYEQTILDILKSVLAK